MNLSTNSIRSRNKRTWSNSRYLENHFDSKLHSTPFLPCSLNDSKQIIYSDIGLSEIRTNNTKLKNFQDLEQRNISIKEIINKQGNWRPFVEFQEKIEMIITIEYCTNCKEHQRSTRHNEEQYINYAQIIKQQILQNYPDIKVFLKPLKFEQDNSLNTLFLQRRIGAFEIQFQVNGQQTTLFSKLQTKQWPNPQDILKSIHSKFKKTNLLIQLTFEDNDTNIKQIPVILQSNNQIRSQSRLSENRSTKSSLTRQRALSQQSSVMRYIEKSDSQGRVLFLNLPIDRYTLIIKETCNNLPIEEIISLHDIIKSDGAYYNIKLYKPKIAVLRIEVVGQQNIPQTDTQVYILNDSEKMLLKEITDNSGIYEGYLEPGRYNLVTYKYGYEQTSEYINVNGGYNLKKIIISNKSNDISILFNQNTNQTILNTSNISKKKRIIKIQQKVLSLLEVGQIQVYDYFTQQPVIQAKIIISDSHYNKLITCTTNSQGIAKLYYSNLNYGVLKIEHKDYYLFEINYNIEDKINLFKIIKKTDSIAILTDQQCNIMNDNKQLDKQINQDMCYFTNLNSLLYIIIDQQIQYTIKILTSQQLIELKQPNINDIQYPQFWILGICNNNNECQIINQIINNKEFTNLYSDIKYHQNKIIKVFNQDYYLNEYNQLSQINKIYDSLIDILFGDDELPIIITNNTINGQQIILQDIQCNIIINQQIIQQNPPSTYIQINKAQLLNKDIYLYFNDYILIYTQQFKFKGYAKLQCYHCQDLSGQLITMGQQISLYQLQITPQTIQFHLKKQIPSYSTITTSINYNEKLLFAREDGVLSIYTHSLESIDHIKISQYSILQIHISNYIYINDRYNVYIMNDQFQQINKIKIPGQILYIYDQLKIITNQATLQYNNPTKLRNYPLKQPQLIFIGNVQNFIPKCYYKNRQETNANINDNQWIVELLNENVRIGLEIKGNIQQIKIILQSQYSIQELGTFNIKRSKGLWIFGFLMYKDDEHIIHEIENKFIEKCEFNYLLNINSQIISLNDNKLIIQNQNGFQSINYLTNEIIQQYNCEEISCIKQFDTNLIVGQKNGCIQIYKKESSYLNKQEIKIYDKIIIDILMIDNQFIISTEDRKLLLYVNKIEQQENLDKSIINNLILYNKNQFISSQIDGRIKLWKKERNGQNYQIVQCKNIQIMKYITQILQILWDTQNILISGELLQLYNIENGKLIKTYQGQQINCIQCIWNNIILSGNNDGQIIKYNYNTGEILEIIQLDSIIQKILRYNEYMMILNEQGIYIY